MPTPEVLGVLNIPGVFGFQSSSDFRVFGVLGVLGLRYPLKCEL